MGKNEDVVEAVQEITKGRNSKLIDREKPFFFPRWRFFMAKPVPIIDDDSSLCESVALTLEVGGITPVQSYDRFKKARPAIEAGVAVVLLDITGFRRYATFCAACRNVLSVLPGELIRYLCPGNNLLRFHETVDAPA